MYYNFLLTLLISLQHYKLANVNRPNKLLLSERGIVYKNVRMCVNVCIQTKEHLILFWVFTSGFWLKISLPKNLEFLVNFIFSQATYNNILRGNRKGTTSNPFQNT